MFWVNYYFFPVQKSQGGRIPLLWHRGYPGEAEGGQEGTREERELPQHLRRVCQGEVREDQPEDEGQGPRAGQEV